MKTYSFLLLFLLTTHFSCTNKTNNKKDYTYDIIKVDIDNAKPEKLSDFYENIRFVKLETNSNNYMPPCQIVKVIGDRIYIGSRYPNNKIFVFDISGTYLFQIGKTGKGPGEWLSMNDFIVGNRIVAVSGGQGAFYIFDLDGNFIEKNNNNNVYIDLIQKYNGDTIIGYTGGKIGFYKKKKIKSNLILLSMQKREIYAEAIPIAECMLNFSHIGNNNLLTIEKSNYYFNPYLDTIYQIENNFHVSPKYVLDFNKYRISPELRRNAYQTNKDFINKIVQSGQVYIINSLSGYKNTLCFTFNRVVNHRPHTYYGFYNLSTNSTRCVTKLIDDMSVTGIKMGFIAKKPLTSVNGEQVWIMEPVEFVAKFEKLKKRYGIEALRERNPQLTEIFENSTDTDNPILVFLKLKD